MKDPQTPQRIARKLGLALPAARAALLALAAAGEAEQTPDGFMLPLDLDALTRKAESAIRRRGQALGGLKLDLEPKTAEEAAYVAAARAAPGKAVATLLLAALRMHVKRRGGQPATVEELAITAGVPARVAQRELDGQLRDQLVMRSGDGYLPRNERAPDQLQRICSPELERLRAELQAQHVLKGPACV